MKKRFLLLFILLLLPITVMAIPSGYDTMNLDEALTQENIEHDFSNYRETDDQVVIYLFRGNGCGYCRNFLTYLNSIIDDYGKYFKVVSFEVWNNPTNDALKNKVATFMNTTAEGVPFIIIGDKTFPGYADSFQEDIKDAIMTEYNKKKRYDVFDEIEKAEKKGDSKYIIILVCNLLAVVAATAIILGYMNNKFNMIMTKLEEK